MPRAQAAICLWETLPFKGVYDFIIERTHKCPNAKREAKLTFFLYELNKMVFTFIGEIIWASIGQAFLPGTTPMIRRCYISANLNLVLGKIPRISDAGSQPKQEKIQN